MPDSPNTDPSGTTDPPTVYTVRFSEYATREIEHILVWINDTSGGDQAALDWLQGLYKVVGGLAQNPKRYASAAVRLLLLNADPLNKKSIKRFRGANGLMEGG